MPQFPDDMPPLAPGTRPLGCAFTPLRILALAFLGLPVWNGVLWALVGDMGLRIGLDGSAGLQLFELFSVGTFLVAVFGLRAVVRRRRRDEERTTAD
jgi:hypothetical protein